MPRKRKTPSTRFPHAVMANYYTGVKELLDKIHSEVWKSFQKEVSPEIKKYRKSIKGDADEPPEDDNMLDKIQEALSQVRETAINAIFSKTVVEFIARRFVRGVNKFNKKNISEQAQVVKAVDPLINEPWLRGFVQASIRENVNYIKTIPEEYFNRIETVIFQGVKNGSSINDMASEIRRAKEVSVNRAKFIARDQTGSILGQMTKTRHENMGVKKFKWSDSDDSRVRDSHEELDGKIFTYEEGADGLFPGRDYNCRCVATPVFDDEEE